MRQTDDLPNICATFIWFVYKLYHIKKTLRQRGQFQKALKLFGTKQLCNCLRLCQGIPEATPIDD
jgi:hypothetical protein